MGVAPGGIDRPDVGELVVKSAAVDLLAALIAISRSPSLVLGRAYAIVRVAVPSSKEPQAAGRIFCR